MKAISFAAGIVLSVAFIGVVAHADSTIVAEDDASQSAYSSAWDNSKNGGSGFTNWSLTSEGNDNDRHSGFYIAGKGDKPDLNGIAKNDKAFGTYANGTGFEQAVAYRGFQKPLQAGDSFSFMIEDGPFEKKFGTDDPTPASVGLILRGSNANASVADYNKDAVFEFGHYQDKGNYQVIDGSGPGKADTGIPVVDSGISVTITLTGPDTYDMEIQTMKDKNVVKLPGRKLLGTGPIQSFAIFNRNSEKYDAFFNQFQVSHEGK